MNIADVRRGGLVRFKEGAKLAWGQPGDIFEVTEVAASGTVYVAHVTQFTVQYPCNAADLNKILNPWERQ